MAKRKATKKPKKWIQGANLKEGALSEMARKAGYSTWQAYCNQENLSPLARRRCNLAKTLTKIARS